MQGFTVKPANPKFAPTSHIHECVLSQAAMVTAIEDDFTYPPIQFLVTPLDKLAETAVMSLVDVVGVVTEIGICEGYSRDGKTGVKRGIKLVDSTEFEVSVTLWGSDAENFTESLYCTFLGKGLRRGEYMGQPSLSQLPSSLTLVDSKNPIAVKLEQWFAGIKNQYNL